MLYRPGQDDTSIELDDKPFYDSQVDGRISLMVGPSGDEEIPSRFRIFWGEIRDGLARNGEGVLQAATELGQIGRDLGNTELSLGSQVTNQLFGAGVYSYDLHSGMFSGYDQAVKSSPPSGPGRYQSPQAAEIQFSAMRGAGTLGLYDLGSDGLEAWRTDDYSEFQHSTGAFGFGVALPYAPRVVTGVGRAAGPYLNPGNYRLNPNSLQSFPSVPLEYNGPTFTRPSGAGPVPVGPQGPTVVQSPPLTGPVTVTGPAAAGSPTADAGGRCCGRSTYDTGRGCYPSTWHF